ncbi:MAG: MFS transporter [Conexivisphaerales archaeon]
MANESFKGGARPIIAQSIAYAMDAMDLTLIVVMASILGEVFLPHAPPLLASFAVIASFTVTTIFRPIGSAAFGNLGDKIGRRRILLITISGFSIASAMTGLLPTYAQVGYIGFGLLVVIRALVGFFGGGEYAGGFTYAIEWIPTKYRGLISGVVEGTYNIGSFLGAVLLSVFITTYGLAKVLAYDWRYIFFITLVPLAIVLYLRFSFTKDSPLFESIKSKGKIVKTPLMDLFRRRDTRNKLLIAFVFTAGLFFSAFSESAFLPTILEHAPSTLTLLQGTDIFLIVSFVAYFSEVFVGHISQLFGRKKVGIIWGIISIIVIIPLLYTMLSFATARNFDMTLALASLFAIIAQGPFGISIAYLSERFNTAYRASGLGFGFSAGIFVAGWFGLYIPWFHSLFYLIDTPTNVWFSVAVMLIIGAVLYSVGLAISGPERKDINLSDVE